MRPTNHFRRNRSLNSPDSTLGSLSEPSSHPGGTKTKPRHQHHPLFSEPHRMRIPSSAMVGRLLRTKIAPRTVHLPTEALSFRVCRDSPSREGKPNTLFYSCSFNPSRTSPDGGKPPRFALSRADSPSPECKRPDARSSVWHHGSETESL